MTGNRNVNWAVVGIGDIVRKRVGPAILEQPDSTLYACLTRDPGAKAAQLESLAPEKVYTEIEPLLADPNVQAVYLATPVFLHAAQAIASLRAGKDVLVEKPMALDAAEAAEICKAAQQTGRRLAVAYYRRFWSRFQLVKEMLDRGQFGRVVLVRIALHSWHRPDPATPGGWRASRKLSGGGVLPDVGSHRLDLLAWWFGLPRRLVADVSTLVQDFDGEDSASILMVLAGGAQFTGSFHWNSRTWTDEIHVVGTEAKVALSPCDGDAAVITVGRDVEDRRIPKPQNAHYPLIDDFARAIIEDRPPRFTADDGMKATQIIDAVFESSRRRTWLEIC